MQSHVRNTIGVLAGVLLSGLPAIAQEVTKDKIPGITNFARLETTVACAEATNADVVPEIKKMGFVSIINLRVPTEPGAEVEKEEAAAKAVGLCYFHIPFDGLPDPRAANQFLNAHYNQGRRAWRSFIARAGIALRRCG